MLNITQPNHLEGEYNMAEKNSLIEQMLEHLVNDETQKAESLFHEYVVSKSREIYEGLIEAEMKDEDEDEEDVEEAAKDEEAEEDKVDEEFEDLALEADDEMDLDSEDPTDDLVADVEDSEEMEEKSEEDLFQDLDAIVDELQARFDAMGGEESGEDEMKDSFDAELETVREYVENVPAGHGAEKKGQAEKADNTTSTVAGRNDMGGQSLKFGQEAKEASKGTAGGLANNKPQDIKSGNVNVPGGKAADSLKKEAAGHGAEKKGGAESADNTTSLFRGRR